jgi:hypothetical protein
MRGTGDSLNREPSFTDHSGRTTRREQADIVLDQTLGQVQKASLVIDGENSCL